MVPNETTTTTTTTTTSTTSTNTMPIIDKKIPFPLKGKGDNNEPSDTNHVIRMILFL